MFTDKVVHFRQWAKEEVEYESVTNPQLTENNMAWPSRSSRITIYCFSPYISVNIKTNSNKNSTKLGQLIEYITHMSEVSLQTFVTLAKPHLESQDDPPLNNKNLLKFSTDNT